MRKDDTPETFNQRLISEDVRGSEYVPAEYARSLEAELNARDLEITRLRKLLGDLSTATNIEDVWALGATFK